LLAYSSSNLKSRSPKPKTSQAQESAATPKLI
jgi:hypothetical protein